MKLRTIVTIASMSALSSLAFAQTSTHGAVNAGAKAAVDGAKVGGAADIKAGQHSTPGAKGASVDTRAGAKADTSAVGASAGTGANATVGSGSKGAKH
jgi:hypothetical protein